MRLGQFFGQRLVGEEAFARWCGDSGGNDPVHHYQMLRASWRYLADGPRKILHISHNPDPWLKAVEHFCRRPHEVWAARHGGGDSVDAPSAPRQLSVELDVWFPRHFPAAAHAIPERGFTLITAIQFVDRLYHPELFFRAAAESMGPDGILIVSASNVAKLENITRLLRGSGVTDDLDAIIAPCGNGCPRPRFREYCWRELNNAARAAGFGLIRKHFYNAPDRKRIEMDDAVQRTVTPFAKEAGQLQSEMILIFRKHGPINRLTDGARSRVVALLVRMRGRLRKLRSNSQSS